MVPIESRLARVAFPLLAFAVALGLSAPAGAQCRVSVDAAVTFGPYNVFETNHLDTMGQISWRCPGGSSTAVQISITRGNNSDATSRRLAKGSEFLRYDLFRDAARSIVWGDGTYGSSYTGIYAGGGWVPIFVYARIPKAQDVSVGTYSDTVTVVVNF